MRRTLLDGLGEDLARMHDGWGRRSCDLSEPGPLHDRSPGRLFIAKGSVAELACDAHIATCGINPDSTLRLKPGWELDDKLPGARRLGPLSLACELPESFGSGRSKVLRVQPWPPAGHGKEVELPQPYLVNIGDDYPPPELLDELLTVVEEDFGRREPLFGRSRHLLGMVVAGATRTTDIGGAMAAMLPLLESWAVRSGHDIAIMTGSDDVLYSAVQLARSEGSWSELGAELREQARGLVGWLVREQLVLFIGAGISMGCGLPSWRMLLDAMATKAELTGHERAALKRLDVLDQATVLKNRLQHNTDSHEAFNYEISQMLSQAKFFSLKHALLASMFGKKLNAITTNYDQLFEQAVMSGAGDDRQSISVLPCSPVEGCNKWLLKMHGCVTDPLSIVITREDYMDYHNKCEAMAGIVQV